VKAAEGSRSSSLGYSANESADLAFSIEFVTLLLPMNSQTVVPFSRNASTAAVQAGPQPASREHAPQPMSAELAHVSHS
jgi:hypothetical protein